MRSPHRTDPYEPAPDHGDAPPNPYDELGALDDGPLEVTSLEDFFHEDATGRAGPEGDEREPEWTPPVHRRGGRRRRGRRAGLPRAVKAVAGVAVLACLVTLADRWAVLYAEHRTAGVLEDRLDLAAAPEVEIGGFPFLTQLADRRLDSVRVTVPDVAADRVSLAKVSATAHDVRLEGEGLTSVGGARVPRLDGDVLLSFADLNRELGASQVTFTGEGRDRVRARGTLPVAGRELRLRAEATIRRDGERGIATRIGAMRLDIGNVATYRPGTGASDGLHLTPRAAAGLARETRRAKALLSVPAIAKRLGLSDEAARAVLGDDGELAELTGSPGFAREARNLNLVDLALDHPAVLRALGLDPGLLDALSRLTRPVLADRLSLSFALPEPERGSMRLRDVRVEEDGIRVRLSGSELAVGGS
ncbi:DUF2993 domain-containing protein [Streptomyces scabiei]|uniref:LmeA family phospholipid-binding protein n=1 Tax=Streptomyces scabiei TaxID=1930 RepID=UPI0033FFF73C